MADQFDAYIKLKGIDGECLDKEFTGKKVCELITLTVSPESQTFTITKPTDTATPPLHKRYCLNFSKNDSDQAEIPVARIWVRKETGKTASSALDGVSGKLPSAAYIVWEFTKVAVKQFDWKLTDTGESEDTITFSFATCLLKYRGQTKTGNLGAWSSPGAWDFDNDTPEGVTEQGDGAVF